ncbi:unnamed protein product [Onchocerca flexuosa]|uniref:Uncharacterized protein n=1 Tax=Onchocerca flexuosa TaxID=387005 RepID=A0A183HMT5_9BILA|nr:unnamed protein product [Onchocerca flexuosa]
MENSKLWWKQTSSRVRYYSSRELQTFHEVDALLCRGELRCAYLRRNRASSIEQIPLEKIFRLNLQLVSECPGNIVIGRHVSVFIGLLVVLVQLRKVPLNFMAFKSEFLCSIYGDRQKFAI